MVDRVEFELVSPEKLLASKRVDMVVVPGAEGDFGVLPRHSPLISAIRPGVIQVYEDSQIVDSIFIAGGFAEVMPASCTILAEDAMPVGDINPSEVEQSLKDLRDDLVDAGGDEEKAAVERKIAVAEAKLRAAGVT